MERNAGDDDLARGYPASRNITRGKPYAVSAASRSTGAVARWMYM